MASRLEAASLPYYKGEPVSMIVHLSLFNQSHTYYHGAIPHLCRPPSDSPRRPDKTINFLCRYQLILALTPSNVSDTFSSAHTELPTRSDD